MGKSIILTLFLALSFYQFATAQSSLAPLNEDYYHLIDRYEIKYGQLNPYFHTSLKGYTRSSIGQYADSLLNADEQLSHQDKFNLEYLRNDNWEWTGTEENVSRKPFLKHFYRSKSDLYHVREKNFDLHINPVLHLSGGKESEDDVTTQTNTRGVQIRGVVDNKVGFYSYIGENQIINPFYVRQNIASNFVVPHEGFWKGYKDDGVDFFTARGYITFNATKHINLQFGHDRFTIGNGHRSMILSDNAPAYLFLKLNTQVWKINYTNIFANLTSDVFGNAGGLTANNGYPEKYMAFHHLGINIGKKLNIGVFESVIFDRTDSLGNHNIDIRYLNPIIFYRAVEQQNGSTDNVLLGLDFKWLAAKGISFYGQFTLDEFLLENLKEGSGWWANKFAVQLGAEYIDAFGINNLDLQAEANLARPYTYSHSSQYGSYSHYRQSLAHPLGANFYEGIGIVRYQPIDRLYLTGKLIYAQYGFDGAGENWGGNILLNNVSREMDFGNEIAQGQKAELTYIDLTASYMFKHNFFIDGKLVSRNLSTDIASADSDTNFLSLSVRWNIPQRLHEF
ncbi:hypothetical protein [Fulvivirga lutea]|uniref:Capsule assembly Wzi family protein n=1 Tax=Fulvivirga lutea TaxID=2810512 RepID=A0A975A2U1_9BACT|nr:hypothetical protein [Fulvivirga lutea]QSE98907.1 hypothetical protein JR347_07445 [Fulvivirga lutea]